MSGKGGRTATTWQAGGGWQSGKTKLIRVPEALADRVMAYARELDQGVDRRINVNIAVLHGNRGDKQDVILSAIAKYIELRRANVHPNQHSKGKGLDIGTRTWDELRRFRGMVRNKPDEMGIKNE